jgi:KDO2-lipid IV(A) lauroyltransferase
MIEFFLKLFSIMPLKLNHWVGTLIGRLLYLSNSQSEQVVRKNIEICFPNLTKAQQQDLIKKSLIEAGKGLSESGFVWFNSFKHNAKHIVKTKGAQYLQGDENTILLVPHFGCWEITASFKTPFLFAAAIYKSCCSRKESSKAFCFLSCNSLYIKVVGLCSDGHSNWSSFIPKQ